MRKKITLIGGLRLWLFPKLLFQVKGLTVGALIHCRIALVGAYHNAVKRTVIFIVAMMLTARYCALDRLVSLHHVDIPP